MKLCRFSTLITVVFASTMAMHGQAFRPLGLPIEQDLQLREFCPRMHVEENTLFVCTNQGLYSKDLANDESEWLLAGFEGIPLQDYARSGNDILALRHNKGEEFLLLSHDGGKTYEDVTPEHFTQHFYGPHVMISLVQHPDDPNTLLVSSYYLGIYQTTDFGKTWRQLTEAMVGKFIGYHPKQPEIIYNSGEDDAMEPLINVSYDGGNTWKGASPHGEGGDMCFSNVAFHPDCLDCWLSCGYNAIYMSTDNGLTWNTQTFGSEDEDQRNKTCWSQIIYDNKCSDFVYAAGSDKSLNLMCSTDGGKSWGKPLSEDSQEGVYDLQQYDDKLLIYTNTDVYEVSKTDLVATYPNTKETVNFFKGQVATIILPTTPDAGKGKYFRTDRWEDGKIVFEQELQPKAHVPYVIVPNEDFSIEMNAHDLEGLHNDTVSVEGVSFIGSYVRMEFEHEDGYCIDIIDKTPDCLDEWFSSGKAIVGALRAYLTWDEPIDQGGAKGPKEKKEIVLLDVGDGIDSPTADVSQDDVIYDLSGREVVNGKLPRGIYLMNGKKVIMK